AWSRPCENWKPWQPPQNIQAAGWKEACCSWRQRCQHGINPLQVQRDTFIHFHGAVQALWTKRAFQLHLADRHAEQQGRFALMQECRTAAVAKARYALQMQSLSMAVTRIIKLEQQPLPGV